jgi:hypothetical protein
MTRDELLELAPLDALGLLDEYDALLFARGFHAASENVRSEIREFQAAVAGDAALLPEVELPAGMRSRVIAAVRREADEAVDLAPLATIGRTRPSAAAMLTLDRPGMAPVNGIRPRRRFFDSLASQGWRAAAFALTASLIVAMYFGSQILDRNRELFSMVRQMQAEQSTAAALNQLSEGAGDAWLLQARKPGTTRIALVGSSADIPTSGMVFVDPKSGVGSLILHGLPADGDEPFRVLVRGEDGEILTEATVTAGPALATASFSIADVSMIAAASFEIIAGDGTTWLASA